MIYSQELIEKGEVSQPTPLVWKDSSECIQIKYVCLVEKWYLVVCTTKGCQVWNHNATRQLTFIESKKKLPEGKSNFFTCAGIGYDKVDGKEFIAVGTSSGEIYAVQISGSSFTKDLGFQMADDSGITAFSGDSRSRALAVGNSNGYVVIFECDNQGEWKPLHNIQPSNEIPIVSMGTLFRGDNLFVVGFANGSVQLIHPNGHAICELSAHSRCLNSLVCHPSKSVFATCSDDTFMNVFEVSGDRIEKIDVSLIVSSRVNDYQLCGIAFGGEQNNSIVAVPYDFKTIAVWNNIV